MLQVSMDDLKNDVEELLALLETGEEEDIFLVRQGKPVIKMSRIVGTSLSRRIGIAKGVLEVPDDLDKYNDEIAEMFGVND